MTDSTLPRLQLGLLQLRTQRRCIGRGEQKLVRQVRMLERHHGVGEALGARAENLLVRQLRLGVLLAEALEDRLLLADRLRDQLVDHLLTAVLVRQLADAILLPDAVEVVGIGRECVRALHARLLHLLEHRAVRLACSVGRALQLSPDGARSERRWVPHEAAHGLAEVTPGAREARLDRAVLELLRGFTKRGSALRVEPATDRALEELLVLGGAAPLRVEVAGVDRVLHEELTQALHDRVRGAR
jgi:hypothetical protein